MKMMKKLAEEKSKKGGKGKSWFNKGDGGQSGFNKGGGGQSN